MRTSPLIIADRRSMPRVGREASDGDTGACFTLRPRPGDRPHHPRRIAGGTRRRRDQGSPGADASGRSGRGAGVGRGWTPTILTYAQGLDSLPPLWDGCEIVQPLRHHARITQDVIGNGRHVRTAAETRPLQLAPAGQAAAEVRWRTTLNTQRTRHKASFPGGDRP